MSACIRFVRTHVVFCIATVCAIVTVAIVRLPIKEYVSFIDFKTLSCLFATLCVICALKNIKFFTVIARKIIHSAPNLRICVLALIYITFIGSLFIANDMALITFLPLGWYVLKDTGNERYTPWLFVLQNISANLGGMLTPFGNPQNLYLYSKFDIPTLEFMKIMFPPFILSVAMLTVCTFFFPKEKMELENTENLSFNPKRATVYLILFTISILMVFSVVPYYIGLAVIVVAMLFLDRTAFKKVDYALLATFFMFFIFSGNMSRIEGIRNLLSSLLEKNTLIVSALSCQFISNVPSAILLSQFTDNYKDLLLGVNIGGTGTIIASLASLITFSEYSRNFPNGKKRYFGVFTLLNVLFLATLLIFCSII